jgi:hypothetical protein
MNIKENLHIHLRKSLCNLADEQKYEDNNYLFEPL